MSQEDRKRPGLDEFLSTDGPRSVLIDTDVPADKTVSTVVSPTIAMYNHVMLHSEFY